jgi:hypothetical protein
MKTIGLSLMAVVCLSILSSFAAGYGYTGGNGSVEDPFQIASVEDFLAMTMAPGDWASCFILTADIDLAGQYLTPVGNEDTGIYFSGSLDGGGYTIRNATITLPSGASVGLFGRVDSTGQISNLTVESAAITGNYGTGALVGVNSGTVSHCHATGNVTSNNYAGVLVGYNGGTINHSDSNGSASGTYGVGGLVGYNEYGSISDCSAAGIVNGTNSVGGLVGENDFAAATITSSYATGSASGYSDVGGLVGMNYQGSLTSCYATGSVSGGYLYVGGLVGRNQGTLSSCYATGSVTGNSEVGGLVGENNSSTMTSCYATGSVTGTDRVGGLVGWNSSSAITTCYATGSANGTYYVGGLVGRNGDYSNPGGMLTSCYATGSAGGGYYVGGLVGVNHGTLTSCYATGAVSGTDYVGGLVNYNAGTITACFWNTQTSDLSYSDGGEGKSTAEMMTLSTFTDAGWDFTDTDGNPPVWKIQENLSYPHLVWEPQPRYTGSGTPDDPYQIRTVADWQLLMASPGDWNQYFIQTADIDMQGIEMTPIGNEANNFTGSFDGQGYRIKNAVMDMPFSNNVGLFGYVGTSAYIGNVHLESVNVTGWYGVGGLIGYNDYSTVINCSVTGAVNGYYYTGGLIGLNSAMTTNCYSTASVSGSYSVGGLMGTNYSALESCHASGSVTAGSSSQYAGGLVGLNYGSLTDCYATGSTTGATWVGGLAGQHWYGGLTRCYSTGAVDGLTSVGGLIGLSNSAWINYSYASGVVRGVTDVGGLIGSMSTGGIDCCYAAGAVMGGAVSNNVGGLVGMTNQSTINTSYSTGWVGGVSNVGGLIGISSGTANNCFWDAETSNQPTSAGGTGKTTVQMKNRSVFTSAGWDFDDASIDGTPAIWMIKDGADYPRLVAFKYGVGSGTPGHPYTIDSVEEFLLLSDTPEDWGKSFILMADLDLSGRIFDRAPIAPDNDPASEPTHFDGTQFTGTLDGNGHTIFNLTIRTENGGDYLGLFGFLQGATIKNLGMENVSITAFGKNLSLGAIAGQMMNSQLSLCVVSGSITAGDVSAANYFSFVGGLVGNQHYGLIESCASRVNLSSGDGGLYLGGIVGYLVEGTIRHAFSAGTIEGGLKTQHVGGLVGGGGGGIENSCADGSIVVGQNSSSLGGLVGSLGGGELRNSYSAVKLSYTGFFSVQFGGLAGSAWGGPVTNCFWDKEINRRGISGDTGLDTAEMMQKSTFTAAGWNFDGDPADWRIRDGQDYPRLVWQPILPGDIAGDPQVNITDLMVVTEQWMQEDCNGCPADVNGDGVVNMTDLSILGGYWLMMPGWGAAMQP